MKKIISFLFVVAIVLVLVPMGVGASVKMQEKFDCTTNTDPNDSSRKITDCNIVLSVDQAGEMDNSSAKFFVIYNYEHDKSDFEIIEDVNGISSNVNKTDNTFNFDFASGLSGSFTAFKIRFYSDASYSGKDCGGYVNMEYNGKTYTTTTSTNTGADNPNTGVSVPVIALGVGVVACLAVYASTSKKTKMHRI